MHHICEPHVRRFRISSFLNVEIIATRVEAMAAIAIGLEAIALRLEARNLLLPTSCVDLSVFRELLKTRSAGLGRLGLLSI